MSSAQDKRDPVAEAHDDRPTRARATVPGPAPPSAPAITARPLPPPGRGLPLGAGRLAGRPVAELAGGVVQGARRPDAPVSVPPAAGLPALPSPVGAPVPDAELDLAVDLELDAPTMVSGTPGGDPSRVRPPHSPQQLPAICTYGRYEILGRIAFGGMAEIFLGRENLSAGAARMLVIKRILPQVADDPAFVEMFLDEARLAIQLAHPNICHIYEFGEIDGTYFIAMEWVHGAPLGKIIRRAREGKGLAPEIAVRVLAQVAEALQYAHTARDQAGQPLGIVHRDVTPHNVMVSYSGQVKLLDFGIAKATSASTKTEAGVVKGKFAYMSPQQCLGRPIDARSDVFALGICLYEALTGTSLYQRSTDYETMRAVIEEPVPSIRTARPELPIALDAIIQRALQKAPEDRWKSAAEMHGALEDWLASTGRAVGAARVATLMEELFKDEVSRGPLVDSTPFGQSFKRVRSTGNEATTVQGTPSAARAMPAPITPPPLAPVEDPVAPPAPRARTGLWVALGASVLLGCMLLVGGIAWQVGRTGGGSGGAGEPGVITPLPPSTTTATGGVTPPATSGQTGVTPGGAAAGTEQGTGSASLVGGATGGPGTGTVAGTVGPATGAEGVTAATGEPGSETQVAEPVVPRIVAPTRPPGRLSIDTRPWSKVYVGSRLLGTTPIAEAEVQSGVVRIRIVDRDGRIFTRSLSVPANQESSVFYNLDEP